MQTGCVTSGKYYKRAVAQKCNASRGWLNKLKRDEETPRLYGKASRRTRIELHRRAKGNIRKVPRLIAIGDFDNLLEAEKLRKYLSTKFLRYIVSILKVSQNVTQIVYKFVPMQDFTEQSDIDWTKSVTEVDQQLYKKYSLSAEEITLIEEKIKPME